MLHLFDTSETHISSTVIRTVSIGKCVNHKNEVDLGTPLNIANNNVFRMDWRTAQVVK